MKGTPFINIFSSYMLWLKSYSNMIEISFELGNYPLLLGMGLNPNKPLNLLCI